MFLPLLEKDRVGRKHRLAYLVIPVFAGMTIQ